MSETNKEAVLDYLESAKKVFSDKKDYTSQALVEVLGQIYWEIYLDMHLNNRQIGEQEDTNE